MEGRVSQDFNPYQPPLAQNKLSIGRISLVLLWFAGLLVFVLSNVCVLVVLYVGCVVWLEKYVGLPFGWGTLFGLLPAPAFLIFAVFSLAISVLAARSWMLSSLRRMALLASLSSRKAELSKQLSEHRKSGSQLRSRLWGQGTRHGDVTADQHNTLQE